MEVYTNAPVAERKVFLEFPDTVTSIDAFVYHDDVLLFEFATVAATIGQGFTVTLPLHLLQHDQDFKVHWTIKYLEPSDSVEYTINRVTPVQVITPILTRAEIREIDPVVFATDAECVRIEKAVRHIIQAYTGQEFGHYIGTRVASGSGSAALFLPQRLLELIEFNGSTANPTQYLIGSDGHTLRYYPWGVPPVKADAYGLHMHTGGVIHNPNNVRLQKFDSSATFTINGRWGWEAIPPAVKEAAKLLVNDYACADSQYRDRYLVSMTAADWRIQFNSGAYLRTGNVRADQLLADYVVTRGWGII